MKHNSTILFLFESTLPKYFTTNTLSPEELRVIAAQSNVNHIYAIGRTGTPFYDLNKYHPGKPATSKFQNADLENKITIIRIPFTSGKLLYYLSPLWLFFSGLIFLFIQKILNPKKYFIVHAESPLYSGLAAVWLKNIFNYPVIIEYRATYEDILHYRFKFISNKFKKIILDQILNYSFTRSTYILANSEFHKQQISGLGYSQKVDYYSPGIRLPKKFPLKKDNINYSNNNHPIVLGYIGRLYPDKGTEYALHAVNEIINGNKTKLSSKNNIKFLIAGEGPELKNLKLLTLKLKLSNIVIFLGTKDRWKFFQKIDILINPNIVRLALEMVNAEAAAASIPVVCFGDKERPVTVIHHQTGIKVPNKNSKKMAEATIQLIKSPQLRKKYGENGHKFYKKHFSFPIQVKRLAKIYKLILSS